MQLSVENGWSFATVVLTFVGGLGIGSGGYRLLNL
jgi:hypothetical protein